MLYCVAVTIKREGNYGDKPDSKLENSYGLMQIQQPYLIKYYSIFKGFHLRVCRVSLARRSINVPLHIEGGYCGAAALAPTP